MKFNERITLIKAGYTKQEIAEMEKEAVEGEQTPVSTENDDRLDIIAQSIANLNDRINQMNIVNSVDQDEQGGDQGADQTDIFNELRNMIENNPTGGNN